MTRVAPLNAEPVGDPPPRRSLTPKQRADLLARFNGKCAECGCDLTGAWEADHELQRWLNHDDPDDLANYRPLCVEDHARKTKADAASRGHVKRMKARHEGTEPPPTQKIKSRGFPKRWERV